MEFLIVSGLSGAGKSTVMSILEDSGFFCVDNLPPVLIPKFAELCLAGTGAYERVAMVCDIRGGENFDGLFEAMDALSAMEFRYKVLFVDAEDSVIIKRYKETRRSHPLMDELGSLTRSVEHERLPSSSIRGWPRCASGPTTSSTPPPCLCASCGARCWTCSPPTARASAR